jgi:hypothetical protein
VPLVLLVQRKTGNQHRTFAACQIGFYINPFRTGFGGFVLNCQLFGLGMDVQLSTALFPVILVVLKTGGISAGIATIFVLYVVAVIIFVIPQTSADAGLTVGSLSLQSPIGWLVLITYPAPGEAHWVTGLA